MEGGIIDQNICRERACGAGGVVPDRASGDRQGKKVLVTWGGSWGDMGGLPGLGALLESPLPRA